ncbi:MAG TPA: hypothetical protein VJN65_02960 [Bacteroidota bacterium]|nr:hypothetical protein [Bacteroidota bacterium]
MISCQGKSRATKVIEGVAWFIAVTSRTIALCCMTGVALLFAINDGMSTPGAVFVHAVT